MVLVVKAFHRRILDRPVPLAGGCLLANAEKHAFDPLPGKRLRAIAEKGAVGPWVFRLCQTMLDLVIAAKIAERMPDVARRHAVSVLWQRCKLNAVVGQYRMYAVRNGFDQRLKEGAGGHRRRSLLQPDDGEFGCAVDRNEHVQLAFGRPQLCDVDMEISTPLSRMQACAAGQRDSP